MKSTIMAVSTFSATETVYFPGRVENRKPASPRPNLLALMSGIVMVIK